ncbi:MAG TPA: VWA domain-containing protein, partial [Anaerolineales bacterium]|nr:VWA domain-containing protein [Anaerolineales bacterium]
MTFTAPLLLLLFLLTPLILWLGWPSRAVSRRREIFSLVLRLIIFASLVLSLAGLELVRSADNLAVAFLVDVSDSMPEGAKGAAVAWVQRAITTMGPDDKAAVVLFGGDALVEHPMSPSRTVAEFTSIPVTNATDLSQAIRLALALFPAQAAKRIVIISDGLATTGNAEEAARLAAAAGVQIMAVPIQRNDEETNEVLVTDVNAPSSLRQDEQFDLAIRVKSTRAQRVAVRVFAGSEIVYEGTLELIKGEQSYPISLTAGRPGFVAYEVQISPVAESDTFYQNNELAAFSQIKGPPRVLVVTGENEEGFDEGQQLAAALQSAGIDFDRVPPSGLPSELSLLAEYASVVIINTPARDFTQRQQSAVEQFVRDLGGGLFVIGGPQSYGVGGYFRTPLEDVLPVEMQLKDQKRRPRLTIVFVIDHSGSMSEVSGGVTKIELAKEAAIRAVELLAPTDKVGVVQFDDLASWVVEITPLDDPDSVINRIASIRSGGGTDIMAGVQAVASKLPDDEAQLKHVILLTDGQASPTGIAQLVEQMYNDNGITMSTVAVGQGADTALLQDLAQAGGGRYHFANDPSTIPEIFTEETTLATRAYIIEEEFFPEQVAPSPIMQGIESVPPLYGYVGTTPKSAAQTILVSQLADGSSDPILASWQYGLGRSVAWTSDTTGRWAKEWVTLEGFPTLFVQAVRFTINENVQSDITADVTLDGETATLAVDAFDNSGNFINNLALTANVVAPDGSTQTAEMVQVAPGRYEANFTPTQQGAYLIRVAGNEGANVSIGETAGWVLSYSPEYRLPDFPDTGLKTLADLVEITGACKPTDDPQLVDCFIDKPQESFDHNLLARNVTSPVWPYLLLLAVLLLPFDIAIRRLVISRYDLQRAATRIKTFVVGFRRPALESERVESLSRLRQAKQRAGVPVSPSQRLEQPQRSNYPTTQLPPLDP